MTDNIRNILADWDGVRVTQHGDLIAISGTYQGVAHSGARTDGISLAHDLARIAGSNRLAVVAPEPAVEIVAEPEPAPEPEPDPEPIPEPEPTPDAIVFEEPAPDPELETLRARITELEALVVELTPPPPSEITEPPPEVLAEAQPDESLAELKARLLFEFASLRNMLIGHIPMTEPQLLRLQALEHPKFQTWLQA